MSVGAVPSSASASDESTALAARLLADKTATLARLAAGIAHELRNPLAVILARVQLLELAMKGGKPLPPGKLETTLRTVGEQAVRASKIIESLSIFARPRVPVLESVDLGQIIGHVLSDLRAESSEDRIVTTEVDVAPEAMTVVADSGQLTTALRQLTLNALQAMPDGGRLRIHARCGDVRGARFRYEYLVERDGERIADGTTRHATVDGRTLRPTRVPEWLVAAIARAEAGASSSPASS